MKGFILEEFLEEICILDHSFLPSNRNGKIRGLTERLGCEIQSVSIETLVSIY